MFALSQGVSWCERVKKWRALLWDGQKQVSVRVHVRAGEEMACPVFELCIQKQGRMLPCFHTLRVQEHTHMLPGPINQ